MIISGLALCPHPWLQGLQPSTQQQQQREWDPHTQVTSPHPRPPYTHIRQDGTPALGSGAASPTTNIPHAHTRGSAENQRPDRHKPRSPRPTLSGGTGWRTRLWGSQCTSAVLGPNTAEGTGPAACGGAHVPFIRQQGKAIHFGLPMLHCLVFFLHASAFEVVWSAWSYRYVPLARSQSRTRSANRPFPPHHLSPPATSESGLSGLKQASVGSSYLKEPGCWGPIARMLPVEDLSLRGPYQTACQPPRMWQHHLRTKAREQGGGGTRDARPPGTR